ncbi:S-adenosyl-L-methionine-dependent methyltransferase, partial [Jimgerdemannia flammicorona]
LRTVPSQLQLQLPLRSLTVTATAPYTLSSKLSGARRDSDPVSSGKRNGSFSSTGSNISTARRFGMRLNVGKRDEGRESGEACPLTPSFKGNKIKVIEGRGFNDDQMKNPRYMLPVDHEEMDRLNMQHYAIKYHLQGNFQAPIEQALDEGIDVLDVGCGTGIWSLEMAAEYPDSRFVGTDVAATYPSDIHPRNVKFVRADTTKGLPFPDKSFDFVYQRSMTLCYTLDQWEFVIDELIRVTKPGGWIQLVEIDMRFDSRGPQFTQWNETFLRAMRSRSIDGSIGVRLSSRLQYRGLHQVATNSSTFPCGWGSEMGVYNGNLTLMAMGATRPALQGAMGLCAEEYYGMMREAKKEFCEFATTGNTWYAVGKRPMWDYI